MKQQTFSNTRRRPFGGGYHNNMSCSFLGRVLVLITLFSFLVWIYIQALYHILFPSSSSDPNDIPFSPSNLLLRHKQQSFSSIHTPHFISTLRQKRILFEVTTVGMRQFAYLEHVLDSVRDLCEAGARISLHITTTNCPPSLDTIDTGPCALRGQSSQETFMDNYPIYILDQLNERLPRHCRDVDGSIESFIHVKSPDWGKQVVDFHRTLFYQHVDNTQEDESTFDVFIHTEEDILIRPVNVLAFLQEMHLLEKRVGTERVADYSMGFIRFENQMEDSTLRRVVWEFEWDTQQPLDIIQHPDIQGQYFTTPPYHHQGMYMATPDQLRAWKTRKPFCHFDIILRRPAYHTERVSGAVELFSEEYCNVTQLIPLDSAEDFYVHHLPNTNHVRTPQYIITTRKLHQLRMLALQEMDPNKRLWVDDTEGRYNGIVMFLDEEGTDKTLVRNMTTYQEYVNRGGMITKEMMSTVDDYQWVPVNDTYN